MFDDARRIKDTVFSPNLLNLGSVLGRFVACEKTALLRQKGLSEEENEKRKKIKI
jgi:hypothetical protein